MEKTGMVKQISVLETELEVAREDKLETESQMQDLRGEIAILREEMEDLLTQQQLPWWKRMLGMNKVNRETLVKTKPKGC